MSDIYFGANLFAELERMQRQFSGLLNGVPSSLRFTKISAFPQINLGATDDSIEIVAFAPGLDPSQLEVTVDKGMLSISGTRDRPAGPESVQDNETSQIKAVKYYARERFSGAFRRVIELPQQADPEKVMARFVDGCLLI